MHISLTWCTWKKKRLSSVLRPEGSARERMDYNFSCNLIIIALGHKTDTRRTGIAYIIGFEKIINKASLKLFLERTLNSNFHLQPAIIRPVVKISKKIILKGKCDKVVQFLDDHRVRTVWPDLKISISIAKFLARNYRTKGQKLSFLDQNYLILNFLRYFSQISKN